MGRKMTNETRVTGSIIKVDKTGWGFISSKEIQFTRIFFHWTALRQDTLRFPELRLGMKVEFTPVEVPGKGVRAIRVFVIQKVKTDGDSTEVSELSEQRSEDDGEGEPA